MTRLNDLSELITNVEQIRAEKYPSIPQDLVRIIIEQEYEQLDSRVQGLRDVSETITNHLQLQ